MADRVLQPVAVVGAGSIGTGFALVFARAGHPVRLYDVDPGRLATAGTILGERLGDLDAFGLLDEPPAAIAARVTAETNLAEAVADAVFVEECAPEDLAVKTAVFRDLDALTPEAAVLASASSAIPISAVAGDLGGRARCLVVHPGNPPYLLSVAELVPAPFTAPSTIDAAATLLAAAGMLPVRLEKEVEGFVFNRLQGAVLREAYNLVRDGVASVEAIDTVMRAGLGRRWAVIGPFETADLNVAGGIAAHAARMGRAYARMGRERGQTEPWADPWADAALVARVAAERRALLPLDAWQGRTVWRDRALMALERCRRRDPELGGKREKQGRPGG